MVVEQIDDERARISWVDEEEWERLGRLRETTTGTVILRESRATEVPSGKLTFAPFSKSELEGVIDQTASELQHFESLYGFAIHSYESYRAWLEENR